MAKFEKTDNNEWKINNVLGGTILFSILCAAPSIFPTVFILFAHIHEKCHEKIFLAFNLKF